MENFEKYLKEKHGLTIKQLNQDNIVDILQTWINRRFSQGIMPSTIQMQFNHLNQFLYYIGIKLYPQNIKHEITFPSKSREEPSALQLPDILQLFKHCSGRKQSLYLAIISSIQPLLSNYYSKSQDIVVNDSELMKIFH